MYPSVITAGGAGSASPIYSVIIEVKLLEQRDMSTPKSNGATKEFSPDIAATFGRAKFMSLRQQRIPVIPPKQFVAPENVRHARSSINRIAL